MRRAMAGHWHVLWSSVFWALVAAGAAASIPILLGNAVDDGLISHQWDRFAVYVAVITVLGHRAGPFFRGRRWYNGVASRRGGVRATARLPRPPAHPGRRLPLQRQPGPAAVPGDERPVPDPGCRGLGPVLGGERRPRSRRRGHPARHQPALGRGGVGRSAPGGHHVQPVLPRVREAISDLQRERGALAGVVEETISGIRAVKGFGTEPVMERRLAASADAVRVEAMRVVTHQGPLPAHVQHGPHARAGRRQLARRLPGPPPRAERRHARRLQRLPGHADRTAAVDRRLHRHDPAGRGVGLPPGHRS